MGVLIPMIPRVEEEKAYRFFFESVSREAHRRSLYTTYCDDRRLPLIVFYLDREVAVVKSAPEVFALLESGRPVAVIVPPSFCDTWRDRLAQTPHQAISTERGKKSFVLLAAGKLDRPAACNGDKP